MPSLRSAGTAKLAALLVFVSMIAGTGFSQTPPKVSFVARTDYVVGADPRGIVTGDLNSDGNLDLVTVSYGDNNVLGAVG